MADDNNKNLGGGFNRRSFLKTAGVAVAGGALATSCVRQVAKVAPTTKSAGATAEPAMPAAITEYRCEIDSKVFNTHELLLKHYAEA